MCKRFRTLEQCKAQYRAVTVDGSVWRVKQRGWLGIGWMFVERSIAKILGESPTSFRIICSDGPTPFPTELDAQTAINKWAEQDYCAQPAAWQ